MTNSVGRPSNFSQQLADDICELMSDGMSLRQICLMDGMPKKSTVFRWLINKNEFNDQYCKAQQARAESLMDELIGIADDGLNDTYRDDNGNVRTDVDVVARSRLRIDARKWAISKMFPKKYGEKISQEITGADGAPLITNLEVTFKKPNVD